MTTAALRTRYAAITPSQFADGPAQPTTQVYVRRRVSVLALIVTLVAVLWLGAGSVLANRGGAPASTSTVPSTYVVRGGDTMWSIAAQHRGEHSQVDYVDALVAANGGPSLLPGQVIVLP